MEVGVLEAGGGAASAEAAGGSSATRRTSYPSTEGTVETTAKRSLSPSSSASVAATFQTRPRAESISPSGEPW